jgi:hypothetical protein
MDTNDVGTDDVSATVEEDEEDEEEETADDEKEDADVATPAEEVTIKSSSTLDERRSALESLELEVVPESDVLIESEAVPAPLAERAGVGVVVLDGVAALRPGVMTPACSVLALVGRVSVADAGRTADRVDGCKKLMTAGDTLDDMWCPCDVCELEREEDGPVAVVVEADPVTVAAAAATAAAVSHDTISLPERVSMGEETALSKGRSDGWAERLWESLIV